jgi:nitrogen-specific signal transduction histidine kinase
VKQAPELLKAPGVFFDPFFTTKKEGNGLGLAIVNTIITRHEGLIEVQSEKGIGTIFHLYLPAIE